jgi:hypothetical protein
VEAGATVQVDSSAILEIDYDGARRRLQVTFVSGHCYAYEEVTAEAHRAFVEAESKGRHFQAEIRERYRFRRLS